MPSPWRDCRFSQIFRLGPLASDARNLTCLTAAVAGSVLYPTICRADDVLVFGDSIRIKPGEFVRARLFGPIVPPGADDDPTVEGGSLRVFDTAIGGAGEAVFDLPADGWRALGKPGHVKGFRFKGGPCTRISVVTGRIRIVCTGTGVTLNPPFERDVGVVLKLGANSTQYGALFPDPCDSNTENVVACRNAGIPPGIPAIGQTPIPTFAPPQPARTPTSVPNPCAGLPDGQTCDAGTDGAVLTCESGVCDTCVPAGTCSVTTAMTCAFNEECPGVETCVLGPDPSPRYVDNGDGTVTDRRTCLVWEQKTGTFSSPSICPGGVTCGDPNDVQNSYAWTSSGTAFDGAAKTLFIDALNGASFAGHSDWRLPKSGGSVFFPTSEPTEFESILLAPFLCGTSPCIAAIFGPTATSDYWSATTYAGSPTSAWYVDFTAGFVNTDFKAAFHFVRAVRGGS